MADKDLLAALVNKAAGHRGRVPVFQIIQPSLEDSVSDARVMAKAIWPQFGDCMPMPENMGSLARMRLPDEGHLNIFPASGAIAAMMRTRVARKPLATDERSADHKALTDLADQVARTIAKRHAGPDDELRFESKWEMKGQGVTLRGEKSPIALFEVLGAFRRYLHGLPVLGRASVHVSVGGDSQVTRWGIDWRRVRVESFAQAKVVTPEEGAKRVLDDLWWRRPERAFTMEDFEPKSFMLGYLSLSRRREQYVMQPAWVAVLAPRGPMGMGHVVAVPAAPQAFEPIDRQAKILPLARS